MPLNLLGGICYLIGGKKSTARVNFSRRHSPFPWNNNETIWKSLFWFPSSKASTSSSDISMYLSVRLCGQTRKVHTAQISHHDEKTCPFALCKFLSDWLYPSALRRSEIMSRWRQIACSALIISSIMQCENSSSSSPNRSMAGLVTSALYRVFAFYCDRWPG